MIHMYVLLYVYMYFIVFYIVYVFFIVYFVRNDKIDLWNHYGLRRKAGQDNYAKLCKIFEGLPI